MRAPLGQTHGRAKNSLDGMSGTNCAIVSLGAAKKAPLGRGLGLGIRSSFLDIVHYSEKCSRKRKARYCEYRSQTTFPISISTLAIETYSRSEHSRAQLSHCLFLPKSRAQASAPAHTILPLRVLTPSLIRSASLLLGSEVRCRQSSMCLHMFFGLLHTA